MEWVRSRIISNSKDNKNEQWIYRDSRIEKIFKVEVNYGKPINILSLKKKTISEFSCEIENIRNTRNTMYNNSELELIDQCPICNEKIDNMVKVFDVYGAQYYQCNNCSHCFIINRPNKKSLDKFYSYNKKYQSVYTDKSKLKVRVNEVAHPKAEYVINQYENKYGKKPTSILDIGAGSGHFVYACRQLGIKADGIEISESGRQFCKENFGIELYNKDFINNYIYFKNYDVITFWGVIEHVPEPMKMLIAANKALKGRQTMIVVEVPRWESFSTSVQSLTPNTIVRHLDPLGHINFFTDLSLVTAYVKSKFNIVSAWYFGMDMYEFITQTANIIHNDDYIESVKKFIRPLQQTLDSARLSDEIVLVGVPSIK